MHPYPQLLCHRQILTFLAAAAVQFTRHQILVTFCSDIWIYGLGLLVRLLYNKMVLRFLKDLTFL